MYLDKLKNISTFIFDIDGVLTDGNIYVNDDGVFSRSTSVKDGYAIEIMTGASYHIMQMLSFAMRTWTLNHIKRQ